MPKPSDIYVHCDELEKIPEGTSEKLISVSW